MKNRMIILPNIQTLMSGVKAIYYTQGAATLEYTDGTMESAPILKTRWAELEQEPFKLISEVQSQRVNL